MQIVYISARPDVFEETLEHARYFMPWISDVVVITPERLRADYEAMGVRVFTDEKLLGRHNSVSDHQVRNYRLRVAAARYADLEPVYLQSDDDNRPIKLIDPEKFLQDGKLWGYYFYEFAAWRHRKSSFDEGQHTTYQVLRILGMDSLQYASHMPQMIDRDLFVEVADVVKRFGEDIPICEWSAFFNIGRGLAPERFHPPRKYETLSWPDFPFAWNLHVVPDEYSFENFYPDHYKSEGVFRGLGTGVPANWERTALDKILRWYRYDLNVDTFAHIQPGANAQSGAKGKIARQRLDAARRTAKLARRVMAPEFVAFQRMQGEILQERLRSRYGVPEHATRRLVEREDAAL